MIKVQPAPAPANRSIYTYNTLLAPYNKQEQLTSSRIIKSLNSSQLKR